MGDINHLRLVIQGRNSDSDLAAEIWQCGIHLIPTLTTGMADIYTTAQDFDAATATLTTSGTGYTGNSNFLLEGGINDIDPMDYLDDIARPAVATWLGTTNVWRDVTEITSLRLYPVGTDGKVIALPVGAARAEILWTASHPDGTATSGQIDAPFASFAQSWGSVANIPRGRGRIFPPPLLSTQAQEDTGLMGASTRTTYATAGAQLIADLQFTDGAGDVHVNACIIGSPFTTAYKITNCSVDSIPDTQRRRKNSLVGDRTLIAVP